MLLIRRPMEGLGSLPGAGKKPDKNAEPGGDLQPFIEHVDSDYEHARKA